MSAVAERVTSDLAERLERQVADLSLVLKTKDRLMRELELDLENAWRIIEQERARLRAHLERPVKTTDYRRLEGYAVDALLEAHKLRDAERKEMGQEAPYGVRQRCAVVLGVALHARNLIGDVHRLEKAR
jgi:hypothetical protein